MNFFDGFCPGCLSSGAGPLWGRAADLRLERPVQRRLLCILYVDVSTPSNAMLKETHASDEDGISAVWVVASTAAT